jgi:hypothetical protein
MSLPPLLLKLTFPAAFACSQCCTWHQPSTKEGANLLQILLDQISEGRWRR